MKVSKKDRDVPPWAFAVLCGIFSIQLPGIPIQHLSTRLDMGEPIWILQPCPSIRPVARPYMRWCNTLYGIVATWGDYLMQKNDLPGDLKRCLKCGWFLRKDRKS